METTQFDFFQNDGYDAAILAATQEFEKTHPNTKVKEMKFVGAYPGRPGEGRWVTLEVTFSRV